MTIREIAIAKLQQLPDSFLQQVSDFIDFLTYQYRRSDIAGEDHQNAFAEKWARWFEAVDQLSITPPESIADYQQHLLSKYRKQGLEL